MVKVSEAVDLILANIRPVTGFEYVFLNTMLDRIAYEDVTSLDNVPNFRRSAMDGYGLVGDCERYKIVDDEDDLSDCTCIRINTGFPIPEGVRAVAEVEIVKREDDYIRLLRPVEDRRNFTEPGVELKKGTCVIKKGERISVRKRALLAYCGITHIKVYRKPVVGILTTGDEVVFPGDKKGKFDVYNANYFIVEGLVRKWFGDPVYFGHVVDDFDRLADMLEYIVKRCDLVLTTGGVSAGSKDFVKHVLLDKLNANVVFDKTTIKPGKPAVFALIEGKPFFGLPGWPSALYAVSYVYLKPLLYRLCGYEGVDPGLSCRLDEPMKSRPGKFYFNRVKLRFKDGEFRAISAGSQKTDNFYSTAAADGLVGIEEDRGSVDKGCTLPLILFDD